MMRRIRNKRPMDGWRLQGNNYFVVNKTNDLLATGHDDVLP
jgi:hypothetical protein